MNLVLVVKGINEDFICHTGFYWVFTIIITACYTGSIIAFVTLPVFPETVDSLSQLQNGFYRIGTLDRGGWERWFVNSSQKETARLLRNLEFVKDVDEGLSNVTKAYFLFPYAFIGSKQQLSYIIRSNYSDEKLGRRSSLHISDECFALFGVGFAFQMQSVYRQKINDGILLLLQSGIIQKIKNDVRWDMLRSDSGGYLQISKEKTLRISAKERGLTLADTEGMFLLLGIGFVVAGGVLISEWVGGIGNKCMQFMRIKREAKEELHRVEEDQRRDDENAKFVVDESARNALVSASSMLEGITFGGERKHSLEVENHEKHIDGGSRSSRSSKQSQSSSLNIADLNPAMLTEMFRGRNRASNIVCIEGQMMSEEAATQYANDFKKSTEDQRGSFQSDISKTFDFLNKESDEDENDMHDQKRSPPQVCEVEINLQAPSPSAIKDGEEFFGEKIDGPKGVKTD